MNMQIMPVTEARTKLGSLTESISGNKYIIFTKGGNAKAALVDIDYLQKLESTIRKLYQKTYLNPKLLPFTREFSQSETEEWTRQDKI